MPKITCEVIRRISDALMPCVMMSVSAKSPPVRCSTMALIDTGSPFTGISPKDAAVSRIKMKGARGKPFQLAGHKFVALPLKGAEIRFRSEDGKILSYDYEDMTAFIPTKTDKQTMREVQNIPGIIGTDLLETLGFILFFDAKSEVAYLEVP